jgi:hypothetical protein
VLRYGHQEQKDGQDDQASLDSSDSVIQLQLYPAFQEAAAAAAANSDLLVESQPAAIPVNKYLRHRVLWVGSKLFQSATPIGIGSFSLPPKSKPSFPPSEKKRKAKN